MFYATIDDGQSIQDDIIRSYRYRVSLIITVYYWKTRIGIIIIKITIGADEKYIFIDDELLMVLSIVDKNEAIIATFINGILDLWKFCLIET